MKKANESQESCESVRTSSRLKEKKRPDFGAMSGRRSRKPLAAVDENAQESQQDEGTECELSRSSGSHNGGGDSQINDTRSGSEESDANEYGDSQNEVTDDNSENEMQKTIDKVTSSKAKLSKLTQIEEETLARINSYEKMLKQKKDAGKKAAVKAAKKKELEKIEAENKRRLDRIAELQRREDELTAELQQVQARPASARKHGKRDKSKHEPPPSAQSTPKTRSEYDNILQHILNLSFSDRDLLGKGQGNNKKLAPNKVREIQSILENTMAKPNNYMNRNLFVGGDKTKHGTKRKEHEISSSDEEGEVSQGSEGSTPKKQRGKVLQSGRTAKVDCMDIKKVVKYPHSKLNREFVQQMAFDDLPLNIFAAGEIELILSTRSEAEKLARLKVLLICLYHSQFLEMEEIREQYDVIMKRVERGELHWTDNLPDKIDRAMDRRARLTEKSNLVMVKQSTSKSKKIKKNKEERPIVKVNSEEFIYCMKYNKGDCLEGNTHTGKFMGRENVLKHHVCRRCFIEKGVKVGHAQIDDRCPYRR